MKILLFGGTTEGRLLAAALSERGHAVTVCVTTELGAEELRALDGLDVRVGRLPIDELRGMLPACDLCVDATHPYAAHISRSLQTACGETGVPLRRILRDAGDTAGCIDVPDQRSAAAFLAAREGNILLTTGAKELDAWRGLDPERIFARVLPTHEGLAACEALGLPHRNIIAMQGPFSTELNLALLRQYDIRWVVTKDGGAAGGFEEKCKAARQAGAELIVISRPADAGITMDALLAELEEGQS